MKKQNLKRIIIMGLIAVSTLIIVPISAELKQGNTAWWYTQGSSLSNVNCRKDYEYNTGLELFLLGHIVSLITSIIKVDT